jgi:hypothetical protein
LSPKTKLETQNFEFKGLLQIPNFECYFEFLSVQYDESIHAPDLRIRFLTLSPPSVAHSELRVHNQPIFTYLTRWKILSPRILDVCILVYSFDPGIGLWPVPDSKESSEIT